MSERSIPQKHVKERIAALGRMKVVTLRNLYKEEFGRETASRNPVFLRKRLAARLLEQAKAGKLPTRPGRERDPRIPPAGTVLRRKHEGVTHEVTVLDDGFRHGGKTYGSLSTLAKAITGVVWNGYGFFQRALREAQE